MSFLLTILIFSLAVIISYALDFVRIDEILYTMNDYKLSTDSYLVENEFIEVFGGDKCEILKPRLGYLKKEIEDVGDDLSKYGQKSFFKKRDYDYLKRKYFLLELKLYDLITELNKNCRNKYTTILFFYEIDDDISERQGYILTDLTKEYPAQIVVFSFDKDYEDEPSLKLIKLKYNITSAPTIIINNKIKLEKLTYLKEIEPLIKQDITSIDQYAKNYDFTFTLKATNTDVIGYIERLNRLLNENISNFAKGDVYLILGRLTQDDKLVCKSAEFYKQVPYNNKEEKALAYETLASLNCDAQQKEYYLKASELWKNIGNYFRAEIDKKLANQEPLNIYYSIEPLPEIENNPKNWNQLIIGNSHFTIDSSDIIISQTDRVTRDWLSNQIEQSPFGEKLLNVFSEKYYITKEDLWEDIGWHEGARIMELKQSGAKHLTAAGTLVKKINNKWYAPDETGIFRFEVPKDKLLYPTTRFLKQDLAVIIDTHGINMIVEQAIRNKATVVIGCGDHPGKIKAAKYLADKGIKVITFPDKYTSLLLNSKADVFGSPPITKQNNSFLIGYRPITITPGNKIVVMNVSSDKFSISYYKTPEIYFTNLQKLIKINPIYTTITDFSQMDKIIGKAEQEDADIIAVRIYNIDDYEAVRSWLEKNKDHKAILFHSMPYPYGYKILKEFPSQTTFGDINPIIK